MPEHGGSCKAAQREVLSTVCDSGMRKTHCKPFGFSFGEQLPVSPTLRLTPARAFLLCHLITFIIKYPAQIATENPCFSCLLSDNCVEKCKKESRPADDSLLKQAYSAFAASAALAASAAALAFSACAFSTALNFSFSSAVEMGSMASRGQTLEQILQPLHLS